MGHFHLESDGLTLIASPRAVTFCRPCESQHVRLLDAPVTPAKVAHLAGDLIEAALADPPGDWHLAAESILAMAAINATTFDPPALVRLALGFLRLAERSALSPHKEDQK